MWICAKRVWAGVFYGWCIGFCAAPMAAQGTGAISGRIVVEGNGSQTVGQAKVYLHSSTSIFRLNTTSNAAGVYRFDGVADGAYEVCATPAGAEFVDSCLWDRMGNPVTVSPAVRTVNADIAVQRAGTLQLVVADTQSLLESTAARTQPFMVNVWTDNFVSLPVFASGVSRTSRTYAIAVPMNKEFSVGIVGPPLRVVFGTVTYSTTEKRVHRIRVDSTKETGKTVAVTVLGVAP